MSEEISDKELLEGFRDPGTRNYFFQLLVRKYQKRLYAHIRRLVIDHDDADDVIQDTFVNAWKGLEAFKEGSTLYTWLYRVATNEALSHLRRKRRRSFVPWVDVEARLARSLKDDPFFKGDAIELKLQQAILTLPEKQRTVFNMRYYDEVGYEEMSRILNTSVGALKASYYHAVKKLENYMKITLAYSG